jgi:hypothetical protein
MPSQDTFFKVKTGLGVGTDTLYASVQDQRVSIGKSTASYTLDVQGDVNATSNLLVGNAAGIGTDSPVQRLDVVGTAIISDSVGIGTTSPDQSFQVNSKDGNPVVITGVGSLGVGLIDPLQKFHFVGTYTTDSFVITNDGYVGIRTAYPQHDVEIVAKGNGNKVVINSLGYVGVNNFDPSFTVDIDGDLRVTGLGTISEAYIGIATVGFATISESYLGITTVGFATISQAYIGFATVGFATIGQAYVGIATVGFASIRQEIVGFSTIGFANISEAYVGIATVGFASISQEIVGFSTIGLANISEEVVGFSTVGFATITESYLGITTVGFASISQEIVGFSTVGFATIGQSYIGIATVGFGSISREVVNISVIDKLLVTGITTSALLDVGIGATLVKVASLGITSVTSLSGQHIKDIHPIVGINTTVPTRTLDVAGDLRVRGEVVDSRNNVGFAYSVLASAAPGITGRFIDAANLLVRNKDFIAEEVVGFITATDGPFGNIGGNDLSSLFDYGTAGVSTGRTKCKRDIGLIIDAIAFDISRGGNSGSVGAGISYRDGNNNLQYLNDNPITAVLLGNGYVETATIAGISSIAFLSRYIVNNSPIPVTHQSGLSTITQLIDTEIAADGDSNTNPNGCSNVVSAIHSCAGIITSIIGIGTEAVPQINYPSGQLIWQPPGARIGNEWFVNKLGSDSNGGTGPGDAFLTIKKAASIASPGDTIKIYAGLYVEDGPIKLNERVAVVGEDLRRTLVTTKDKTDLYYVKRGCYISQQSFIGPSNPGRAMVSFPTQGYGYADGTEENWQSPYVQNCTNFVPDSIGMRIDGSRAGGFKSMVLDAYTQYNQGGIGVSITNFGYAQLVSLFTICCDTAVYCDSGGVCDLNNSNCSFGNYALVSNGATPLQYTGTVVSAPTGDNVDTLVINVGVGASEEFIDAASLLRSNKDFIASEVVGFVTSTSGPFAGFGSYFDYGGSKIGRDICRRDSKLIIEAIASDLLNLGNINSIECGLGYRDSVDGSLTYLPETSPPPVGFNTGYVKQAELSLINHITGISTYIIQNIDIPTSYQTGVGTFTQYKDLTKTFSPLAKPFIQSRSGIITSIIGIGTEAVPQRILPKGQRPYDGQIAVIDTQYYFISGIEIDNPGSGYDPNNPVEIIIDLPPNSDFFIPAEAAIFEGNVSAAGTITSVEILVSGTGYDINNPPNVSIAGPPGVGVGATGRAILEKYFFRPTASTQVSAGGTTTVTFDQFITYAPQIGVGSTVYFYQSSKIIASSITFEYVGTGINIVNAIPSKGAVPITENQIVATNGGSVPFTSTDQGGNFRISEGITINQNTGTISGQAFSKSLQAEVTPLIIALQS